MITFLMMRCWSLMNPTYRSHKLARCIKGDRARKTTLVEYGFRLPSALDNRPMRFEEWEAGAPQAIFVSATPGPYEKEKVGQVVEQVVRPTGLVDPEIEVRPAKTQVDDVLGEIRLRVAVKERVLITTLTKRMAEDLTDYLDENGGCGCATCTQISTPFERVEIIRDLRLGEFDVLVGINLLREGLDMPEVSLVAILDADKEGFLRSDRSLIQTIGRAARNLQGKAILYGDKITNSMQRAMDETDRRREKQEAFNTLHGIEPVSISSDISDVMEGARVIGKKGGKGKGDRSGRSKRLQAADEVLVAPDQVEKNIVALEKEMFSLAKDLEFEAAAQVRDRIEQLREQFVRN